MAQFNQRSGGSFGGGGRRFGGGGGGDRSFRKKGWGGGGRDGGERVMHRAVCSKCHKDCEIPFRPTGDKPVYCNDCFGGRSAGGPAKFARKDFGDRGQRKPQFSYEGGGVASEEIKKQLSSIDAKLDKLISVVQSSFAKEEAKKENENNELKEETLKSVVKKATKKAGARKK